MLPVNDVIHLAVTGLAQGCAYGLIALGFVLIYKATEVVNFAHGEFMMLGAFTVLAYSEAMGGSFWPAFILGCLSIGAVGYLLKKAGQEELIRGVRDASEGGTPLSPSLSTVLVSRLRDNGGGGPLDLTARQKDVLRMVSKGDSTKEIADQLFMSPATVKRELRAIFDRLSTESTSCVAGKGLGYVVV